MRRWDRGPAWLNQHLFKVIPAPGVDKVWLQYLLDYSVGELEKKTHGTTMKHITKRELLGHPVWVPPLNEQRRIVDLISSIDHAIDSLDDLEERKNTTALSITSSLFSAVDFGDTPIRDLLETSIGGVWGGEPGTSEVDVRVYRSTEFNPDGALTIEGGVTRSITKRQLLSRRLQAGDILLEKSGGGPNQPVGRVALVPEHAEVAVCANFVQLLRPDKSKVDPIYLWGLLWWWHATGRTQVFQRRTTGIRNLQTTAYLEQKVTLPPLEEQQKVASLLRKVDAGRRSTRELRFRLADLRSSLIANLLSGAHEIPDSYDRFLEETS